MKRWLMHLRGRPKTTCFVLGELIVTAAARRALSEAAVPVIELLDRHQRGDWGQVDELDRRQNELGIRLGLRIRSAYAVDTNRSAQVPQGVLAPPIFVETVWIITSPDRRRTTVLLPREIFDDNTPYH